MSFDNPWPVMNYPVINWEKRCAQLEMELIAARLELDGVRVELAALRIILED